MVARHPLKNQIDALVGPVYGHKTPTGCSRMRNSTYVRRYNERPFIFLNNFRPSHAAYCQPGLKVCASLFTLMTLLYFDADTHQFGSTDDVRELFRRLRGFFPRMPEPVVDERGGSGWLVVDTRIRYGKDKCRADCTEAEYNRTVFRTVKDTSPELCLERWFQGLADGLDIEFCEVKGRVYEHNLAGGRLLSVKAGDLMKVPPSGEWLTQPSIPFEVLLKLAESNVVKTSSPSSAPSTPPSTPAVNGPSPQPAQAEPTEAQEPTGSFRARILTDAQVAHVSALAGQIDKLLPGRPLKAGRYAMTDLACAEMLVALCLLPVNADDTCPYRRVEAFINGMCEGDNPVLSTRFQYERYKALRDYLDGVSLMDWIDNTYSYVGKSRRATKWEVSESLKTQVLAILEGNATQHTTTLIRTRSVTKNVCVSHTGKTPYVRLRMIGQKRQKPSHAALFAELDRHVRRTASKPPRPPQG